QRAGEDVLATGKQRLLASRRLETRVEANVDAAPGEDLLREKRELLGDLGQDAILGVDEDDADLLGIETAVAPRHAAHEVVELGRHLDARESPAGDHEGEELAAQFRIVILDGSFLEGADDVAA